MLKRLLIGFAAALALGLGLGMAVPGLRVRLVGWLRGEPFARGRPAGYWVETLATERNPAGRREAADALREIGPSVVPSVIRALKEQGGQVSPEAREYFVQTGPAAAAPLAAEMLGGDKTFRDPARRLLLRLGPQARQTVPALVDGLADKDPEVRRASAVVLARVGPAAADAVPVLAKALSDADPDVRREAAAALGRIGACWEMALPALAGALRDPNAGVRREAAEAVGRAGAAAKPAVSALVACLADRESVVREQAAWALGRIGPAAHRARQALQKLLRDDQSLDVRRAAAVALGDIGPAARAAAPTLLEAAFSPFLDLSSPAADALAKVRPDPAETAAHWERMLLACDGRRDEVIVEQTQRLLRRGILDLGRVVMFLRRIQEPGGRPLDRRARVRAALILASLDPGAEAAVPGLVRGFRDPATRARVKATLVRLGQAAVHPLCGLAEDADPRVRAEALDTLARLQPPPRGVLPLLVARLIDRDPEVAKRAEDLLARITPRPRALPPGDLQRLDRLLEQLGRPLAKEEHCRSLYELSFFQHVDFNRVGREVQALVLALKDRDRDVRLVAAYALGQFGGWYLDNRSRQALAAVLSDTDPAVRAQATHTLARLGPQPGEAAALLRLFHDKDREVRWRAVQAFSRSPWLLYGAVAELAALTRDPDPAVRREAIGVLGNLGYAAQSAVPELIKALRDPHTDVRNQAMTALGAVGPAAKPAVPELVRLARSADRSGRLAALAALGRIGPAAEQAVRDLRKILGNERNDELRRQAAWALGAIGPAARAALPDLRDLLAHRSVNVRVAAAEALWQVGQDAGPVVRILRDELKRAAPGSHARGLVASALGRVGPPARAALPDLLEVIKDPDAFCRSQAVLALGSLGPATEKSAQAVVRTFQRDPQPYVRGNAAGVLQRYGPADAAAVGPLTSALQVQPQFIRKLGPQPFIPTERGNATRTLVEALGRIGPPAAAAVDKIISLLRSPFTHPVVRAPAIEALGKIGPAAAKAIDTLVQSLNSSDPGTRFQAAQALPRVDASGKEAVSKIGALLLENNPHARDGALQALQAYGPRAAGALPQLLQLFDQSADTGALRTRVIAVLGRIGGPAKEAVPRLRERLNDPREAENVRLAAAGALWKIARSTEGIPLLVERLPRAAAQRQFDSFQALAEMGPDARAAVRPLVALVQGRDPTARGWAVYVLGSIGRGAADAVPALAKEVADPNSPLRVQAIGALGQIGPAARAAVPPLRKIVKEGPANLRGMAASTLGLIGEGAREALPELAGALREKDLHLRLAAAGALWSVDRRAKDALPVLRETLKGTHAGARHEAAVLLARMGPAGRAAGPALRRALDGERDTAMRLALAEALWRVTGDARAAVGVCRAALKDPFLGNRVRAARVLGEMGPAAREALADLDRAARDPEPRVREEAARALKHIEPARR
jgi:HEAT repeat protein